MHTSNDNTAIDDNKDKLQTASMLWNDLLDLSYPGIPEMDQWEIYSDIDIGDY